MKQSFIFSGSGGQGIMSAGITLAHTAIDMGKHSTYMPEYGPQQRGGSAKCTVVINDDEIYSPLPFKCDNLIVMNEQALRTHCKSLKAGGVLISNESRISPEEIDSMKEEGKLPVDIKVVSCAVDDLAINLGNVKAANIILLGILIGATGIVSRDTLAESLKDKFKKKKPEILEMNLKALDLGIEIGSN